MLNLNENGNSGTTSSGETSDLSDDDPGDNNGNPSMGVAVSLIPLAVVAFITTAAKHKKK